MPTPLLNEDEELIEAVKAGREEKVRALLACGGDVTAVDKDGKTPFHWACQYGHLPILCLLLSRLPPSSTPARLCPVHPQAHAADGRDTTAEQRVEGHLPEDDADCLSEQSPDVLNSNSPDADSRTKDSIGDVRTLVRQTRRDLRDDNCTCGKRDSSHVINSRDAKGHSPLIVACNYRRADVAAFLVTLPYCQVNCADHAANTPLHRAIHNDLDNLACLLCDAGADVRAANSQLLTPLHEAIRSGNENVVRTLLRKGCDVNAVTNSDAAPTPFLTAIFYYKISMRSWDYRTFLDTVLRLLIESGCKLSQGDYQWTPLSACIDIDNSFVASLLLFNGCRFQKNYSKRSYGRSLLVEAFTRCESYVVKLLVLCGYQPCLDEVDQCSRRIPSFSPVFYRISRSERQAMKSKVDLLEWLRHRARSARSLMELSRTAVRAGLSRASDDTSILKRIPELPLPKMMRQYVGLSDFRESTFL